MGKLSKMDTVVLVCTAAAGIKVATGAAAAASFSLKEDKSVAAGSLPKSLDDLIVKLPALHICETKEELWRAWGQTYVNIKNFLPPVFKFTGQMFVAPIAMMAVDALYKVYLEHQDVGVKVQGSCPYA